jgi:hypothetical protein
MGMNGQQQFQQIHHELTVFAGFEDEPGQLNNYPLTGNIGAFTHSETVWVLGPYAAVPALTYTPKLTHVFRTDDGKIAYMNQYDAEKYCNEHGLSFPTAYELALALNPKGVSEIPKNGFVPIYKRDGSVDFYYNASTYPGPSKDDEDKDVFWSSSISPKDYGLNVGYAFRGERGEFYIFSRFDHGIAVRCAVWRRDSL